MAAKKPPARTRARTTKKDPNAWRVPFLEALSSGMSITTACKDAKVGRSTAFDHRQRDEAFALAWHQAMEAGADLLEDEARRRAAEGTIKPVYQGGKKVGEIREYSDTLLIFLLKGKRPDVYRDNVKVEHTGKVQHDLTAMSDAELEALERELDGRTSRK